MRLQLKKKVSALSVNVHASARQCGLVQFWREIVFFSLLALNKLLSRLTNVIVLRFVGICCNFYL